jgi:hypothetical protein
MHLIAADRVKARPLAVIQALTQGKGAVVKCGPDGQRKNLKGKIGFDARLYAGGSTAAIFPADLTHQGRWRENFSQTGLKASKTWKLSKTSTKLYVY